MAKTRVLPTPATHNERGTIAIFTVLLIKLNHAYLIYQKTGSMTLIKDF